MSARTGSAALAGAGAMGGGVLPGGMRKSARREVSELDARGGASVEGSGGGAVGTAAAS